MVVVPTIIGLIVAALLFDVVGRKFGGKVGSFLRATYYLPQILPIAVAGIVIGWIVRPGARRRAQPDPRAQSASRPSTGWDRCPPH